LGDGVEDGNSRSCHLSLVIGHLSFVICHLPGVMWQFL
jgi:hypothetical protein